jgi:adenylate cyclase
LLTSKEIIERTGISRATLNNYIASGLVPRPQVLPPGPQDGAAPRIGYFPDDTIARVETIQRLKREGWSMTRIAEYLVANPPAAAGEAQPAATAARAPTPAPASPLTPVAAAAATRTEAAPSALPPPAPTRLSLEEGASHPAYLVDDSFRLLWLNDQARTGTLSPLGNRPGGAAGSIFRHLMELRASDSRDAILRFHLQAAKSRGANAADLFRDLQQAQARELETLYQELRATGEELVAHLNLPAAGTLPARLLYAVQFRDAVLFAYAPRAGADGLAEAAGAGEQAPTAPDVRPVAVLVSTLEDAAGLWVKLTAQEYFELLNEIWVELDRIFRRNHGQPGRPGEIVVCYFLPQADGSYHWNALAAAQQTRDAMRQLSRRWKLRKGWDVELHMNIGVDEGQDWIGTLGGGGKAEMRVMGDAADRAEQMARCSRAGAILVTRNFLGKLPAPERQRLTYGVSQLDASGNETRVLFTFARLAAVAAPDAVAARVADLAVAALLDLHSPTSNPAAGGAGQ